MAKKRTLDFTNVKDRSFNIKHLPAGDYPAVISKVEDYESKAGNEQYLLTITLTGGGAGAKGASYPYYCGLDKDSLWKIRNVYASCGVNIPKKKVALDPDNQILNKALGVTLDDDEYDDKMKSVVMTTMPVSDINEDDDEGEDTAPAAAESNGKAPHGKKGKGKKGKRGKEAVTDDELEELDISSV